MSELLMFDDGPMINEITSLHVTIAWIPHITGVLSVLGSFFVCVDILRDPKKHQTVFHRIMFGLSLSDLMASLFLFLSTWPIPIDTLGVYGAVGNLQTCQMQGLFIQLGVGGFFYTTYLGMYYLCVARYHWKECDFEKVEWWGYGFAILVTFGTAIASLYLKLYNNATLWCWIAPYPLDCVDSSKNNGISTCERGDNAYIYRVAFFFAWMWLAVIVLMVCMLLIVLTLWTHLKTMRKLNTANASSGSRDFALREVAVQACLYIGAFFLTVIYPSLVQIFHAKWNSTSNFNPLTIMTVTFFPLQGFWNAIIYVRPRFRKAVKDNPTWSYCQVVGYTIGRTIGWDRGNWYDQDYKLGTMYDAGSTTTIEGLANNPSSSEVTTKNRHKDSDSRRLNIMKKFSKNANKGNTDNKNDHSSSTSTETNHLESSSEINTSNPATAAAAVTANKNKNTTLSGTNAPKRASKAIISWGTVKMMPSAKRAEYKKRAEYSGRENSLSVTEEEYEVESTFSSLSSSSSKEKRYPPRSSQALWIKNAEDEEPLWFF